MTHGTMHPATVILVHGAFADASGWQGVIERLQAHGVPVVAPANPLRGIAHDSAYRQLLHGIPGPVIAVGHSYGGAVITNAAMNATNVIGLVYVAAFAPDEGERLAAVAAGSKDSVLSTALVPHTYPAADGLDTAIEFTIDPAKFRDAFAADVPASVSAVMAATQRPVAELAFSEPSGAPAWKRSRRGRWSQQAIRPPAPTSCAPWQFVQGPGSPRSRDRTSSWSRSRRSWPT